MHQRHFVEHGGPHLEDDVAAAPQLGGGFGDAGAGLAVVVIAEVGQFARTALHHHLKTQLDQLDHGLGHGGHPFLAREDLARHTNALRCGSSRAGCGGFGRSARSHGKVLNAGNTEWSNGIFGRALPTQR
ncbi:hypothetical protein D9M69_597810 [compost metagenome]